MYRFEDWLAEEVEKARLDYRDLDPGENYDMAQAIKMKKEILEDVWNHLIAFRCSEAAVKFVHDLIKQGETRDKKTSGSSQTQG